MCDLTRIRGVNRLTFAKFLTRDIGRLQPYRRSRLKYKFLTEKPLVTSRASHADDIRCAVQNTVKDDSVQGTTSMHEIPAKSKKGIMGRCLLIVVASILLLIIGARPQEMRKKPTIVSIEMHGVTLQLHECKRRCTRSLQTLRESR